MNRPRNCSANLTRALLATLLSAIVLSGCTPRDDLEDSVTRMASIGYAFGPSFSPDGRRVAYVSSGDGLPEARIAGVDGSNDRAVSTFDDPVSDVRWSPVGQLLALQVAPGGGLNSQIYLVPAGGGEAMRITRGGRENNWLVAWSDDGRYLSYSSNVEGEGSMDCWLYDTQNGESRLIVKNQGIGACRLSPGNARAVVWRMRSRGDTNQYLVDLASGEEQLLTPHEGVALSDQALFWDENTLLLTSNIGRERKALALVRIDAEGRAGPLTFLTSRGDAELEEIEVLPESGLVALLWNANGRSELAFRQLATGQQHTAPRLPAEIASGLRGGPGGSQLALTVSGSTVPTDVWRLDLLTRTWQRISTSDHRGVDLDTLVPPELHAYRAHDGLMLSGWLYRAPTGATGRATGEATNAAPDEAPERDPGPVVINFHGGPEGQERPRFRATYQALASRGISVFAPNVRGSSGFGKTFVNADNGPLRFAAIRDIETTVQYLVNAKIADPDRVGIMGGSYGGYMTMAGLTFYPDLFAAGANLFGVVNFETFFEHTEPWMAAISTVEYGDPEEDAALLTWLSPINHLDRVRAPTLVLHGANDTNVPVVEAEQVVERLRARGLPVKYVLFPDEGHGWRRRENRITSDLAVVRWFERYLVDGAPVADSVAPAPTAAGESAPPAGESTPSAPQAGDGETERAEPSGS